MFQPIFIDHILFILFGLILPANAIFRSQPLLKTIDEWSTEMKLAFYRGNSALLWGIAAVILAVWYFAGRPLADLGLQWPEAGTWERALAVSGAFLLAYGIDAWLEMATPQAREKTSRQWRAHTPFLPENKQELRGFYHLAFSAAVGEEVLFRAYFITYLLGVLGTTTGDKALALVLPTIIFALSHYYQGWKAIAKIAVLSLAFGIIFLISRSLLLPVLLHFIVDVMGGWLGFRLLRESDNP
jgi:membrane protease YdiL (CAAX protease family)